MSTTAIARAENLFDFFHASVGAAAARQHAPLSEEGLYYLSNLLVERGRTGETREAGTLVELYQQAVQGGTQQTVTAYRELGDRTLYTSGFFRASLARRLVSLDYYMQMGSAAYQRLARLARGPRGEGKGLDEVFAELGDHFEVCSDLLQEVRAGVAGAEGCSDTDVLRLYEEWLVTGSPAIANRLRELGVLATKPGRNDPQA